jgi:hypothetical protein
MTVDPLKEFGIEHTLIGVWCKVATIGCTTGYVVPISGLTIISSGIDRQTDDTCMNGTVLGI